MRKTNIISRMQNPKNPKSQKKTKDQWLPMMLGGGMGIG